MGGEKIRTRRRKHTGRGSPPRGRGKAQTTRKSADGCRITPAWAGKSFGMLYCSFVLGGSPPRGRGKVLHSLCGFSASRITPAWAGKSRRHAESRTKSKDHPRVGGEKLKQRMCSTAIAGSPPRGRGKDKLNVREDFAPGITPAWAGKRPGSDQRPALPQDHPRVGGEKHRDPFAHAAVSGSPPRGRGKVIDFSTAQYRSRITPAWAGKRVRHRVDGILNGDHPRVGGEKHPEVRPERSAGGSPPRGRGKGGSS